MMTPEGAIKWLGEAEEHFRSCEGLEHWTRVLAAKRCREVADVIRALNAVDTSMTRIRHAGKVR